MKAMSMRGLVVVGSMLLGLGVGALLDHTLAGLLIGLGAGHLAALAIARRGRAEEEQVVTEKELEEAMALLEQAMPLALLALGAALIMLPLAALYSGLPGVPQGYEAVANTAVLASGLALLGVGLYTTARREAFKSR